VESTVHSLLVILTLFKAFAMLTTFLLVHFRASSTSHYSP